MLLKRIHARDGQCVGVEVKHTGDSPEQVWDQGQVMQYASEGWLRLDGDTITVTDFISRDALSYEVLSKPGYFVRSTGERIPVSELAMTQFMTETVATLAPAEARAFLAAKGLPANDYEASRHYRCRLNEDQHSKYRAVRDVAGNVVAAYTLEG